MKLRKWMPLRPSLRRPRRPLGAAGFAGALHLGTCSGSLGDSMSNSFVSDESRAILGVPKKGRLHEKCMKLLAGIGLEHTRVRWPRWRRPVAAPGGVC